MKKKSWVLLCAVIIFGVTSAPEISSAALYYAADVGGGPYQSGNGSFGNEFSVGNTAMVVERLGIYDAGLLGVGQGLSNTHTVGIYQYGSSQPLLTSVTIPSGTSALLENGFRWVPLASPVTLKANTSYVLAAYYPSLSDYFYDNATVNPAFTALRALYFDGGSGLTLPTEIFSYDSGFYGPNMSTTPVPIPAVGWLLGSGLLGLIGIRKKLS